MLDPSVFKAYDVRGVYPTELDEEGAYRIARGYAEHFEPLMAKLEPFLKEFGYSA